jgi:hypothetical protein
VFCADTEADADVQGFRIQGPAKELSGDGKLAAWSPLVVIAPQCPQGQSWDKILVQRAAAAAIDSLLADLAVDPQRLYLTGSGAGGTGAWQLAAQMRGRFAAVAPICGLEVRDRNLVQALAGTEVHIITGIANGFATDCANRMKFNMSQLRPPCDVVYESMGNEVADAYYAKQDFYQWLLDWHRPPGKASTK